MIHDTVTINRPISEVFSFVSNGETAPRWRPGVLDATRQSGDGGVGTVYRQGVKGPMGRRIPADYEVTGFEPDRLISFKATAGQFRPHGRIQREPRCGRDAGDDRPRGELAGLRKLMSGAVAKTMKSEVRNVENLKRILESS
jgi:hypothetical protein